MSTPEAESNPGGSPLAPHILPDGAALFWSKPPQLIECVHVCSYPKISGIYRTKKADLGVYLLQTISARQS